ncbi:HD domain-containing protein [Capnocytophaga canimorsus]|uniref:HD domain-containing protein n=1 Tax=Capnocytophaga canimorsus TaxID=28188 RepID=UPI001AC6DF25|nr:HD domain-containing protein [Capnocytophaga canimorsus]GIM59245.1 phosphohydrolase [Capnocytophaga canimorsus]
MKRNKLKIINDPVYGFIHIPGVLIFDLIEHPYFQRLRRISQMGLSYLVYPGARHTRFHHALGCMHLMQKAVQVLQYKGIAISQEEEEALYVAILLHDIGHGPFSHAMEHSIVEGISHEEISLRFMQELNNEFGGKLDLAIQIFTGNYPRNFLHELISSQLDMDRSDYLKRDSFYTGVAEGNINSERIIAMLNVKNDQLVVEDKAIYSVEKFLVARRLMYWQVYLHKTSVCAEQLLIKVLKRAKELAQKGYRLEMSTALRFFVEHRITEKQFDKVLLDKYALLDDNDIISAMKEWQFHSDFVLSSLSKMLLNRDLPRVKLRKTSFEKEKIASRLQQVQQLYGISQQEAQYFVFSGEVSNIAYNEKKQNIYILTKTGKILDVAKASDQLNLEALSERVVKNYLCYPKELD